MRSNAKQSEAKAKRMRGNSEQECEDDGNKPVWPIVRSTLLITPRHSSDRHTVLCCKCVKRCKYIS